MKKFSLMFIAVWIVMIPIFLLFGADPRDIFNIFLASLFANIVLLIYSTSQKKRTSQ